jgi:hypothetical protein
VKVTAKVIDPASKRISYGDAIERRGGGTFLYLAEKAAPDPRVGIFMKGGCDLLSLFVMEPLIAERLHGTCCIFSHGLGISDARPDILLQTRQNLPEGVVRDVLAPSDGSSNGDYVAAGALELPLDYFRPVVFEPTFRVPGHEDLGEFPKTLIALSVGPAAVRSVYRHRTHGYVVDPGGFWLNESMEKFLTDPARAKWFKDNFESRGRMSVSEFYESFGEVVRLVKRDTGAQVLVFNTLVIDPGDPVHNYQFTRNNQTLRRRELDVALRDLSREHDFYILDVDKLLKLTDVHKRIEFAHFPAEYKKPIAFEAYRILTELEVFAP